jgi:hypothetical protein
VGGWRVLYTYPKRAPRAASPDDTTLLSIEERPPSSMPVHYSKHPRHIRVGRRTVEVYAGQGVLVGQWTSARARYVAIMNGARAERRLREVITCVP